MKETAAEVLVRTAKRWHTIKHLSPEQRKRLMALPEADFSREIAQVIKLSA